MDTGVCYYEFIISITYRLQMMKNKFSLKYKPRFHSSVGRFLDLLSYIFTYPWIVTTSLTISTFLSLSPDQRTVWRYTIDKALLGPALLIICLILTPFAVSGFCLWIFISTFLQSDQFSSIILSNQVEKDQENYSFGTMNVLLGQEALGKFNNASLVYGRIKKIAAAILAQDQRHLTNMDKCQQFGLCWRIGFAIAAQLGIGAKLCAIAVSKT